MASSVVHVEIPADDLNRAKRFYSEAFGWQLQESPDFPGYPMVPQAQDSGAPGIALMQRPPATNTLVVYFGVESVDQAVARIQQLGGTIVTPKSPVRGMGWFAQFLDTEGNLAAVWQMDPSVQ